jgi:Xaa-Pro aminopeptidase
MMVNLDKYISSNTAVLICTDVNRFYLSGVKSSAGYLLKTHVGDFLFVDGRYFEMANKTAFNGIKVVLLNRLSKQLNEIIERFKIDIIYTETDITVSFLNSLCSILNCKVVAQESLSEELLIARSVKTKEEINNVICAQRIAEKSFEELLNFIKVGVTEKEIALFLDYEMGKRGSEGVSFETIAVSGNNSSMPHGVPTDKPLNEGDFLTLDFGAIYKGYHSDMTRTLAIGYATDKMQEVYNLVLSAQNNAIEKISAGISCKNVDAAARDIITKAGFGGNFSHSTGHGVGLCIHEYPNLSNRNDAKLISGQVVTVEPGVYLQGVFGVRIEDMIVVRKNERQNLTNAPKTLIIL